MTKLIPKLVALEVTRRCPFKCRYCRASADLTRGTDELSFGEITKALDNIATHFNPVIILTGGEPLSRPDILKIAAYGKGLGLRNVLATCGYNLSAGMLRKIKDSGIERLSFSIDSSMSLRHDLFRGIKKSFEKTINSAKSAFEAGLPFQINTTVTKNNMFELRDILDLAIKLKAASFHPFFMVPVGRAKENLNLVMNVDEYETALMEIAELEKSSPIEIKVTCAPQYHRVAGKSGRGCLAGTAFAFISHTGKVQTCGFLDIECGNLRKCGFDFKKIWDTSEVFQKLRNPENYDGKCSPCNFHNVCGGCRARAYEVNGSYLASEPYCGYSSVIANEVKQSN